MNDKELLEAAAIRLFEVLEDDDPRLLPNLWRNVEGPKYRPAAEAALEVFRREQGALPECPKTRSRSGTR
jgi:hypothetical protein